MSDDDDKNDPIQAFSPLQTKYGLGSDAVFLGRNDPLRTRWPLQGVAGACLSDGMKMVL